jgi:hypothetical protein
MKNDNGRHGDVLCLKSDLDVEVTGKRVDKTLAYGEVTGHSHRLDEGDVEVFEFDEKLHGLIAANIRKNLKDSSPVRDPAVLQMIDKFQFSHIVKVKSEKATLIHEEHKKQTLTKGIHGIGIQVSFRGKSWQKTLD